ncbi:MAG: serine--tRNA ligase, partial [Silvibacterium sp.]|nr:serine--tRNA ligase [Silvibacterium sp.]
MLDLSFVRANLELVEQKLRDRGQDPAELLVNFRALDIQRRARITEAEQLKAQLNKLSEDVARLKRSGQDAAALLEQARPLKLRMEGLEAAAAESEAKMQAILTRIPNLPLADVPVGKSEQDNVEIKRWGEIPKFDFAPKPHWELGEQLGILDFERAAKISGARFAVYWRDGAKLERALANFMLDVQTREHGYAEVLPPFMVNSKSLFGTGQLPKFAEDQFHCDDQPYEPGVLRDNDHWLIPTAEVPVTNLYRDEVLDDAQLPRLLTAWTPCFRLEAGSYGKDV